MMEWIPEGGWFSRTNPNLVKITRKTTIDLNAELIAGESRNIAPSLPSFKS